MSQGSHQLLAALLCVSGCASPPTGDDSGSSGSATRAGGSTSGSGELGTGSTGATVATEATGTTHPGATTGTSDASTGDSTDTSSGEEIYPEPDWMAGVPEEHGLSSAGLAAMADLAEQKNSNCLVVTRDGVLVGEWYWNDFGPEVDQDNVYSVTKSITSALVGIAEDEGSLDVEGPAGFPEWKGTASEAVRVRDLISNDSGRAWTFDKDYVQMGLAPNQTNFALGLGQDHAVGTWWEYNNAAIQTLERALSTATGSDVGDYAEQRLFSKIHMSAKFGRDGAGDPLTYQGVSASCRDLARFGYLYLRGGRWAGGVQVVPSAWVAASIAPSTALNDAYGFMWWLNREGHWVQPSVPLRTEGDGQLLPTAPAEVFAAIGAFGQFVVVDPTTDSVWVRLGPLDLVDASGFGKLAELWDAFAAAEL